MTPTAISALLDEAAELAAANEKVDEALAIAERVEAFNEDRAWFKARPDHSYRARLATQQEVADRHSSGAWPPGWVADESCFVWAIVRATAPLETLYSILPPPERESREDELRAMWGRAAVEIARGDGDVSVRA